MSQQAYYVPESSKLPFAMAISLLVFIIGASNTVIDAGTESNSYLILLLSFVMIWTTMYFWFKQTIQENHAGLNNPMLKDSYVYGMAWFIFSEVMFFFAFFFALAYIRNFAVPWLGGEGEKGLANMLWPGFEATWPLMIFFCLSESALGFEYTSVTTAWCKTFVVVVSAISLLS